MVCELDVHVGPKKVSSSLIHYICTYPTMQCRGYASKVMKLVFEQDTFCNKVVYAVSKLPLFHITTHSIVDLDCAEVKNSTIMQKILQLPDNGSSGFLINSSLHKRNCLKMTKSLLLINAMD
mmetsp:Transcript_52528/g.52885  ORF Transcript_52528/g.52885 Transcript_52528/m.52885 type:complete len:122 (-) Transcript_52528:620-985(-)